jgi:hypothetical protein
MAMARAEGVQDDLMATWAEMPRSPGHAFYDRLQELGESDFDAFVEQVCKPCYAPRVGAPSLPPGPYFRMHMIGYFEGIDSERGIAWRCADSFSLRDFLRLSNRDKVPDHSWLSRTRSRRPHQAHVKVFGWVLRLVAEHGLVKGERIGLDARRWRPTPRCARSCGATTARATVRRGWRKRAASTRRAPRTWRASTASARARCCRTTTGRARPPRRRRSPR